MALALRRMDKFFHLSDIEFVLRLNRLALFARDPTCPILKDLRVASDEDFATLHEQLN